MNEKQMISTHMKGLQLFVKQRRKKLDLSQSALAKKIGMPRPTYAALELYGSNMNMRNIFAIINALDSNLIELQFFIDQHSKSTDKQ